MDHDHQRVSIFFLITFLEVSKKKSDDKYIYIYIYMTKEKWEMKRWNSRLEGKTKKKRKKEKDEMEGKMNKYFFSLLLYLSHVWIDFLGWVGPHVDGTLRSSLVCTLQQRCLLFKHLSRWAPCWIMCLVSDSEQVLFEFVFDILP